MTKLGQIFIYNFVCKQKKCTKKIPGEVNYISTYKIYINIHICAAYQIINIYFNFY